MTKERPVYALLKGLKIIETLAAQGQASAAELARWTGMPRPTVYRLLGTLQSAGYVTQPRHHDDYRLSRALPHLLSITKTRDVLAAVAHPILEQLSQEVVWPCDISAYENGAMVIHATTHPTSPLSVERIRAGRTIDIVTTATGLAYLAFCSEAQKNVTIDALLSNVSSLSRRAFIKDLDARIELTRRQGCGLRVRGSQPKTSSMAVPLLTRNEIIGCLTLNWLASALEVDVAMQRYLKPLQQAATRISRAYNDVIRPVPKSRPSISANKLASGAQKLDGNTRLKNAPRPT